MKKLVPILFVLFAVSMANGQTLKPYILGSIFTGNIDDAKNQVSTGLEVAGFTVVGQYMPVADASRWVIIISHPALDNAVKSVGGLTGFASTLRLALTKEDGVINVSYTNPVYWGNAYFRSDFDKVSGEYTKVEAAFKQAVSSVGDAKGSAFGSEEGVEPEDLRKYHYMFGMPYFDETKEFGDFDNHEDVIAKIEKSLKWGKAGVKLVYKHDVPETKLTLYGFALEGETGEGNFMPKIDIGSPKHTAFLPYEFLVMDNEVHMLHGRFRIALSFPDLTMGTFTKIMSTPGDIEDLLKQLVED
jgi:hypothetical protein